MPKELNCIKVGITGNTGFIGSRLSQMLKEEAGTDFCTPPCIELIPFERTFFDHPDQLRQFVRSCTVIVHLACVNRHPDPQILYNENIRITRKLIEALTAEAVTPALIYSSSIRETENNHYGRSKLHAHQLLKDWATRVAAPYSALILPNIYGPGAKPFYNSFIATFCAQLIHGQQPIVTQNRKIPLLYIDHICLYLISKVISLEKSSDWSDREIILPDFRLTVSEVLKILNDLHEELTLTGALTFPTDINQTKLLSTLLSYFK